MEPANEETSLCEKCKNCLTLGVELRDTSSVDVQCATETSESKCQSWLETCTVNSDGESVCSSETSVSTETDATESSTGYDSEFFENGVSFEDRICLPDEKDKQLVQQIFQPNVYREVRVNNSERVHVGNVIKIKSLHLTQTNTTVTTNTVKNQLFLNGTAVPVRANKLSIIDRRSWLAQYPVEERQYLESPAKYVVISHTATEDAFTQAENVYLVRIVQSFHIESRKWADIAYNFLVGSDGNVYEGRGWGAVGAHTYGYNAKSLGISFVGCFMDKLPPKAALNQAKLLLKHGLETGAIDKNYILVGHCQCTPTESPGRRLYEEIQTWEHWADISKHENINS